MPKLDDYEKCLVEEFLLRNKKKGVYLNQDNEYNQSGTLNFTLDQEFYTLYQSELNPHIYSLYFYSQASIENLSIDFIFDPEPANKLINYFHNKAITVFKIGMNYSSTDNPILNLNNIIDSYYYDGDHFFYSLKIETPVPNVTLDVMFDVLIDVESDIMYISNRFFYDLRESPSSHDGDDENNLLDGAPKVMKEFDDFNSLMLFFCQQHVKKWDDKHHYYIKDHVIKYLLEIKND